MCQFSVRKCCFDLHLASFWSIFETKLRDEKGPKTEKGSGKTEPFQIDGGQRGIRTLEGCFHPYSLSRGAPSASRPAAHLQKYISLLCRGVSTNTEGLCQSPIDG